MTGDKQATPTAPAPLAERTFRELCGECANWYEHTLDQSSELCFTCITTKWGSSRLVIDELEERLAELEGHE